MKIERSGDVSSAPEGPRFIARGGICRPWMEIEARPSHDSHGEHQPSPAPSGSFPLQPRGRRKPSLELDRVPLDDGNQVLLIEWKIGECSG